MCIICMHAGQRRQCHECQQWYTVLTKANKNFFLFLFLLQKYIVIKRIGSFDERQHTMYVEKERIILLLLRLLLLLLLLFSSCLSSYIVFVDPVSISFNHFHSYKIPNHHFRSLTVLSAKFPQSVVIVRRCSVFHETRVIV